MRKLSEQEIALIHSRLKSLHIRYTEVYEEVFDHYHSALEECSDDISEGVFKKLNGDFSNDTVRKMEESREKFSKKLITQLQWNELKFWRNNNLSIIYQVLLLSVLAMMFHYFDVPGMFLLVGVFSLLCIPIIWFSIWNNIMFSLRNFSINSSKAFPNEILSRSMKCYSGLLYFGLAAMTWNDSNYGHIETLILGILNISVLLNFLTLVQVVLKWKQKQSQIANQ